MKRDLSRLSKESYDVVIVGGGIFGACAAWDAALRGYSVALVERDDFASGASAHSYKMVHGGIRYLQHADIMRLQESCRERSALLRIAPHLVQPLPILIPTYGYGREGKWFLGAGMLLYDMLTLGRNRGISDPERQIPRSNFLSRREVLDLFPDVRSERLTGGAVFCDGQMYNPTRLVLAFLRSAAVKGASLANYVEATSFLRTGNRIHGIVARDRITGETFDVRARCVLNAAGGWSEGLLATDDRVAPAEHGVWSRDACFVVKRRFPGPYALAIQGKTRDPDAVLGRSARHLFLVPWRGYTLVGVWHVVNTRHPDEVTVSESDLQGFIDEINWAYPALRLDLKDVTTWNAGLVPFGENDPNAVDLRYGKHSRLIDHESQNGIQGLVTLMGIRYTMARGDASSALDLISRKLGVGHDAPPTHEIPVFGGDIENFDAFTKKLRRRSPVPISRKIATALAHNYGTSSDRVLNYAAEDPDLARTFGDSTVLAAEFRHAIRHEMAVTLADLVFRRTDLASGGNPGYEILADCARMAAKELGWSNSRMEKEMENVIQRLPVPTDFVPTSKEV